MNNAFENLVGVEVSICTRTSVEMLPSGKMNFQVFQRNFENPLFLIEILIPSFYIFMLKFCRFQEEHFVHFLRPVTY